LIERVYSYVAWRLGAGPEAEDVTSEVFERALRYRDRYDPRKGERAAWLVGIARRCVDGALASRAEAALAPSETPSQEGFEEASVDRLSLQSALQCLEERDRELIALRYGADLKAREIADLLGLRTNAVEVALHRALAKVRSQLAEEPGFGEQDEPERETSHLGL
jgi:RNA polymerase sigma-70 factor (ECF subfamily)